LNPSRPWRLGGKRTLILAQSRRGAEKKWGCPIFLESPASLLLSRPPLPASVLIRVHLWLIPSPLFASLTDRIHGRLPTPAGRFACSSSGRDGGPKKAARGAKGFPRSLWEPGISQANSLANMNRACPPDQVTTTPLTKSKPTHRPGAPWPGVRYPNGRIEDKGELWTHPTNSSSKPRA
jgi:hypothetical protein